MAESAITTKLKIADKAVELVEVIDTKGMHDDFYSTLNILRRLVKQLRYIEEELNDVKR